MSLQRYLFELQQFNLSMDKLLEDIIYKNENKILRLVRERLYQKGEDGTGKLITPFYTDFTVQVKKDKNQRVSFVTLRDTGAFYSSMFLKLENRILKILSNDPKSSELIEKYGEAILEFTDYEKELIFDTIIEPGLLNVINNLNFNTSSSGGVVIDTF